MIKKPSRSQTGHEGTTFDLAQPVMRASHLGNTISGTN